MRYTPHTPSDKEQMLRVIGIDSVEELYRHVPERGQNPEKRTSRIATKCSAAATLVIRPARSVSARRED